jgi:hypothetical protein
MTKRLSDAGADDYEKLQSEIQRVADCTCAQEAAQKFVDAVYESFSPSLVLLRLFMTVRYDELPEEDRRFVDGRGRATNTSHLILDATPIFTLLGTSGNRPEWHDRRASAHFRCIPLASTAFVFSLSMLSRQFESVGLDLSLIDDWEAKVTSIGRADRFRGMLYIGDAGIDRDSQGRMIVPKQDFVAVSGVKTTFGFGSGYAGHPTLVTLFAFTNEYIEPAVARPMTTLLDHYMNASEKLIKQGTVFPNRITSKTPQHPELFS